MKRVVYFPLKFLTEDLNLIKPLSPPAGNLCMNYRAEILFNHATYHFLQVRETLILLL